MKKYMKIFKWNYPESYGAAAERYEVIEDRGERVLIRLITGNYK